MPHPVGKTLKALIKLPRNPEGCWTWLGKTNNDGVPQKQFDGKPMIARRWLWEQLFGPIPDGLIVGCACGNKACMNPQHFRCTTLADAQRAGLNTSLLPADVVEIKAAKADRGPNTARVLADRFGCSVGAVRDIWRGRTWRRAGKFHGPKVPRNQHSSPAA